MAAAGAVVSVATFGCAVAPESSGQHDPPADAPRITVLHADPAVGVSLEINSRGRVLRLQSVVGAERPEVYRTAGAPLHEIDLRVVDATGRTVHMSRGGDRWVDPTWTAEAAAARQTAIPLTNEDVQATFEILKEDLPGLLASLEPSLVDHAHMLRGLAGRLPTRAQFQAKVTEQLAALPAMTSSRARAGDTGYYNGCASNVQFGEMYGCQNCVYGGDHTAVHLKNFNYCNGTWDESVDAMNHADYSLWWYYYGYSTSGWNGVVNAWDLWDQINWEGATNLNRYGGCYSGYDISAGNGHVCNDDSAYELMQVHDADYMGWGKTSWGDWSTYHGFNGSYHACNWYSYGNGNVFQKWSKPGIP